MIFSFDGYIKTLVRNLEMLWCVTLNDGFKVYSDYGRPGFPEAPWLRLKKHCNENNLYPVKIQTYMFGAPETVLFDDPDGLDGVFVMRGSSKDYSTVDGDGTSYKQLIAGRLLEDDTIEVKKFCWPENELEKMYEIRLLTPENARLMFFKNDSRKIRKEAVQIALNGGTV